MISLEEWKTLSPTEKSRYINTKPLPFPFVKEVWQSLGPTDKFCCACLQVLPPDFLYNILKEMPSWKIEIILHIQSKKLNIRKEELLPFLVHPNNIVRNWANQLCKIRRTK